MGDTKRVLSRVSWPINTPLEIRMQNPKGDTLILTMHVSPSGIIKHKLDDGRGSASIPLSVLETTEVFPSKAVKGWQQEAIDSAETGMYHVVQIK